MCKIHLRPLILLSRQFYLRFIVIQDRFDTEKFQVCKSHFCLLLFTIELHVHAYINYALVVILFKTFYCLFMQSW